ncbi:MAG: hypothetical protein K8R79_10785, partial [Calditrichales bacterium]|nr:hypothetical protein [Calditrichales bacterium]
MKKNITILILGLLIIGCNKQPENQPLKKEFSVDGKDVLVYTTAAGTNLRLTHTGNKAFENAERPQESQVSLFVNPNKTFQTFWGIGGS